MVMKIIKDILISEMLRGLIVTFEQNDMGRKHSTKMKLQKTPSIPKESLHVIAVRTDCVDATMPCLYFVWFHTNHRELDVSTLN